MTYEKIILFGEPVLFTQKTVKRSQMPNEVFIYDVRHDDECLGIPCEIKEYILANFWGTIISKKPIKLDRVLHCKIIENPDTEWVITDEYLTLDEYLEMEI